jgi:hypothetical protein
LRKDTLTHDCGDGRASAPVSRSRQIAAEQARADGIEVHAPGEAQRISLVTDFGFQPGIQEYWMLLSDWRNGSFAILLAPTVLFFATTSSHYAIRR